MVRRDIRPELISFLCAAEPTLRLCPAGNVPPGSSRANPYRLQARLSKSRTSGPAQTFSRTGSTAPPPVWPGDGPSARATTAGSVWSVPRESRITGKMPTARSEERRVGKECRYRCDWSSDVCSSDLAAGMAGRRTERAGDDGGLGLVGAAREPHHRKDADGEIGRASCRERV